MSDVKLFWDTRTYNGDILLDGFDLEMEEGLMSAVFISLFSWRRANDDDVIDTDDRQGWWADAFAENEGDKIGSRLWILLREKITTETLRKAEAIIRESLQWMIDDKVASDIEVSVFRNLDHSLNTVDSNIAIIRNDGTRTDLKFDDLWKNIRG